MSKIEKKIHSRAALVGNPSDGFKGKTIATPIKNFEATVTLSPSKKVIFEPNSHDKLKLDSLGALNKDVRKHGYYGGIRLIKAACKKFYDYCQNHDIELKDKRFKVSYQTSIPRQMGLGGSSAIIIATLKALIEFYGLSEDYIPKPLLANLALSVETEELDISAGLQDRVVQAYSEPVYMDFSDEAFEKNDGKYGIYKTIDKENIPNLFLIYSNAPSESGKVHSKVGWRFKKGEKLVVEGMEKLAKLTDKAYQLLKVKKWDKLPDIFNKNFNLRRKIYGDKVIGKRNLEMIKLARDNGLCGKFSGSGGAIIGIWQTKKDFDKLKTACNEASYKLEKIKV